MSGATNDWSDGEGLTLRTALVFLIFLAIGPPFGALLVMTILDYRSSANFDPSGYLPALGEIVPGSYVMGGLQALLVAFVASIAQARSRTALVPLRPVIFSALFVSAAVAMFEIATHAGGPKGEISLIFLILHVGSGIACWLLCNAVLWPFRRRSPDQVAA